MTNRYIIRRGLASLVVAWLLVTAPMAADADAAGSVAVRLSVNPVIVTLDSEEHIRTVRLHNTADERIVMQAFVNAWHVTDNEDRYVPTDELIVTPPVFTISPGEEQIVRVGLQQPVPSDRERAYRVYFEQSPSPRSTATETSEQRPAVIRMNLRIGIPVFIRPDGEHTTEVSWRADRRENNRLTIHAHNRGNVHARISRLVLADNDSDRVLAEATTPTYLLSGSTRSWHLQVPEGSDGSYRLRLWSRHGSQEITLEPD